MQSNVPPVQWSSWIWFVLMTLAMLWLWQEGPRHVGTRTISYSQFKEYVRNGEVINCVIQQTEITGKIQPRPKAAFQEIKPTQPETKGAPGIAQESTASSASTTQAKKQETKNQS